MYNSAMHHTDCNPYRCFAKSNPCFQKLLKGHPFCTYNGLGNEKPEQNFCCSSDAFPPKSAEKWILRFGLTERAYL